MIEVVSFFPNQFVWPFTIEQYKFINNINSFWKDELKIETPRMRESGKEAQHIFQLTKLTKYKIMKYSWEKEEKFKTQMFVNYNHKCLFV